MFLLLALYFMAGTTLAGILIVAALTANMFAANVIIWAAVIGFVAAIPLVLVVARKLKA